jgi:hypothetical protein
LSETSTADESQLGKKNNQKFGKYIPLAAEFREQDRLQRITMIITATETIRSK